MREWIIGLTMVALAISAPFVFDPWVGLWVFGALYVFASAVGDILTAIRKEK